ncbi:MAG TPA: alpha-glucuronidase family glycosyl hydrolase [Pyrinomonadaceae bacterium]|jgi:alpha-glucuronidase|nr:alpha-glucuronidase family glycosyl hydrolase [Pyrinomonadaceae bacterium]
MRPKRTKLPSLLGLCLLSLLCVAEAKADDGYRLWLRYERLPPPAARAYGRLVGRIVVQGKSATLDAAREELSAGLSGLLGKPVPLQEDLNGYGAVIVGTPDSSPFVARRVPRARLKELGPEGFIIRSVFVGDTAAIVIASEGETGALYGVFHFLRLLQTLAPLDRLDVSQSPRMRLRVLNHWDNLDGTIERGYAGRSLWDWDALPDTVSPRLRDYARANASVGINGSVLNNVNANSKSLSAEYLQKTKAVADGFRPYGVRVYLSARFSAPVELGGLKTADPLDPSVAAWWKQKADEIYKLIPDFGGFLVKANSEGQPGPRTYNRTHADGANLLARALAPHGGVCIWRTFVYDPKPGYDRAAAAFDELQPFDGRFEPNVLLQVKNGPIDFQPREPFHPLFGAMSRTPLVLEVQITQEYLGFSNHLVFLAPMWREVLASDTHARGPGSTVARVVSGSLGGHRLSGMAGVANTGSDLNWTGHHFAQANWYAFGRLAWNPDTTSEQLAREWTRMTLTRNPRTAAIIERLMLESREAAVDYMTPLGLHHIMWGGHHYGPAPWENQFDRADWNPVYYHRADARGLGFDRTATGSNAVAQYRPPVRALFSNPDTCPEKYLLWFHHVPWDYRMRSGRTMWVELASHYQRGVEWTRSARRQWESLRGAVDDERHADVARKLAIQERDAVWWRDACLLYFQTFSKRRLPAGVEPPRETLEEYKRTSLQW